MAQAVLRHLAAQAGLAGRIEADSAGTRAYEPGGPAHPGTLEVLLKNGIDAGGLSCRGVTADDFERFERILAVDQRTLARLAQMTPAGDARVARAELLLPYGTSGEQDLLDPFPDGDFARVFTQVEEACRGLLADLVAHELARGR